MPSTVVSYIRLQVSLTYANFFQVEQAVSYILSQPDGM